MPRAGRPSYSRGMDTSMDLRPHHGVTAAMREWTAALLVLLALGVGMLIGATAGSSSGPVPAPSPQAPPVTDVRH